MYNSTADYEDLKETTYVIQKYLDKLAKKIQKLTPPPNLEKMTVTGKEKILVLDYMVFEKIREHLEKNQIFLKALMEYEQDHKTATYKVSEIKQKRPMKTCKGKSCKDSRTKPAKRPHKKHYDSQHKKGKRPDYTKWRKTRL